eukprot:83417-Pyramimonas_sp.AAC.1
MEADKSMENYKRGGGLKQRAQAGWLARREPSEAQTSTTRRLLLLITLPLTPYLAPCTPLLPTPPSPL